MKLTFSDLLSKIYYVKGEQIHDLVKQAAKNNIPPDANLVDGLNFIFQNLHIDNEVRIIDHKESLFTVELPWRWRMVYVEEADYNNFLKDKLASSKFEYTEGLTFSSVTVKNQQNQVICGWSRTAGHIIHFLVEQ